MDYDAWLMSGPSGPEDELEDEEPSDDDDEPSYDESERYCDRYAP